MDLSILKDMFFALFKGIAGLLIGAPTSMKDKTLLDVLNSRLNEMGYQIAAELSDIINKKLKECQKKE